MNLWTWLCDQKFFSLKFWSSHLSRIKIWQRRHLYAAKLYRLRFSLKRPWEFQNDGLIKIALIAREFFGMKFNQKCYRIICFPFNFLLNENKSLSDTVKLFHYFSLPVHKASRSLLSHYFFFLSLFSPFHSQRIRINWHTFSTWVYYVDLIVD